MHYANFYESSGLYHVSFPLLMGTRFDALSFGNNEMLLKTLWNDIETELTGIEKMLNRFDRESEVSKVNERASFSSVAISDALWQILQDCKMYYEQTDGCFDVSLSDFSKVVLNENSRSIQFEQYGLALDFGGYAKGYALRKVRERLSEAGVTKAFVNFGNSSIAAMGTHPFGDSWPIGIKDPFKGGTLITIKICDAALSVSGNTPDNLQHIVIPQTSQFVEGRQMVAVVADDPVDAEVLTTAWIASGCRKEPQWLGHFRLKNTYLLS